eukprot:s353_g9.t1
MFRLRRLLALGRWPVLPARPTGALPLALQRLGNGLGARSFASTSETDPYKILGVDRNASQEDIKKAYKKQAMKWHPDRQPPEKREEAQKRFSQVANAYETLTDSKKRQEYDMGGFPSHGGPGGPTGYPAGGYNQVRLSCTQSADVRRSRLGLLNGLSFLAARPLLFAATPPRLSPAARARGTAPLRSAAGLRPQQRAVPGTARQVQLAAVPRGRSPGMLAMAYQLVQSHGPRRLLSGAGATFTGYFLHGAFKYGLFEMWKTIFQISKVSLAMHIPVLCLCAFLAELLATVVLCPAEDGGCEVPFEARK